MSYSLITLNKELGPRKKKEGGGIEGRGKGGGMCYVLGGDFVLSVPNPFLKRRQSVMCMTSHG